MRQKSYQKIALGAAVVLSSLVLGTGCFAEEEKQVINIGQTRMAATLNPLDGANAWSLTSHGLTESVYEQDARGKLVSRFIADLSQTDDNNWKITLNEGVCFSDGSEVNAQAFSDCINEIMEKNEMASIGTAGIMTCTPTGDYTLNLQTENVTHILQSNLAEYTIAMFKDLGNSEYAFTGPYMAENLEPDVKLEMEPNPYYPDAEKRSNVTIYTFGDANSMKLAFEAGEIDMASTITADVVDMLEGEGLQTETYDAGYQYFIYCNLEHEITGDLAVRQAINLALSREDMITALKGGRVATGMFATYYSFAGDCATEYDLEQAKSILEEDGWGLNSDGIREKDGTPLKLKFITYASRPDLPTLMQIAVSQLEELGIQIETEIVSNITESCSAGDFDLAFYAQHTASTGDPAYFLRLSFFTDSTSNFTHYSSEEFESIVNQMNELPIGEERDLQAKKAQEILRTDLPVIYMIDPQWHIAVSERLSGYTPYCGDYYTVNAELGIE